MINNTHFLLENIFLYQPGTQHKLANTKNVIKKYSKFIQDKNKKKSLKRNI